MLDQVDWELLSQQKLVLLKRAMRPGADPAYDGLINFLDALQDAAEQDGRPVVWLHDSGSEG
jgi:L-asparaginase/Glu-tRNA(Gln) amidotransferase subunit D